MFNSLTTDRLNLELLGSQHMSFIYELLNSPEWIRFIGERNIRSLEDAKNYIQKITDNPTTTYWVVSTKDTHTSLGLITLIKRDYLEHHDIGFAFLNQYTKKGYAFEAAKQVILELQKDPTHHTLLGITLEDNKSSIQLLEKLGLHYTKEIVVKEEKLLVYEISKKNA